MEFPKFEGFKLNTIAEIEVPKLSLLDLSPDERESILNQKDKLEEEKRKLIQDLRDSVASMPGRFKYRELEEVDLNDSQVQAITDACINLTIGMIKSYFPKTDEITDAEYEEFIQALANAYYEEKTLEYLSGGSKDGYTEIK